MIVFCTKCWIETDSSRQQCPRCGADLAVDSRSYEEKLISSLDHPLPQARALCLLAHWRQANGIGRDEIDVACAEGCRPLCAPRRRPGAGPP